MKYTIKILLITIAISSLGLAAYASTTSSESTSVEPSKTTPIENAEGTKSNKKVARKLRHLEKVNQKISQKIEKKVTRIEKRKESGRGMALASAFTGGLGLVLVFTIFGAQTLALATIGVALGIIGLVLGILSLGQINREGGTGQGFGIFGIVTGSLAILFPLLILLLFILIFSAL